MDPVSKVDNIELLGGMIKHLVTNRGKLDMVFDLEDGFRDTIWMKNCIERLREDLESTRMFEERYLGPEYEPDEMLKLLQGSLGYTYAFLMKTMSFKPHFHHQETESFWIMILIMKQLGLEKRMICVTQLVGLICPLKKLE